MTFFFWFALLCLGANLAIALAVVSGLARMTQIRAVAAWAGHTGPRI